MSQHDLFTTRPLSRAGDVQLNLGELVRDFESGRLLKPAFQRDFIWPDWKIRRWGETVVKQTAFGCLLTYQLSDSENGDHPVFLCDGVQRLTATKRFMEDPARYKFKFGIDIAAEYVKAMSFPVQHRIWATHTEAFQNFKAVNLGTTISSEDYYKGELFEAPFGKELYLDLIKLAEVNQVRIIKMNKRKPEFHRGALALFYRFITPQAQAGAAVFKNVSQKQVNDRGSDRQVEVALREAISPMTRGELDKQVRQFQRFLERITTILRDLVTSIYPDGEAAAISFGLYHHLLHTAIYAQANKLPPAWFERYATGVFSVSANRTGHLVFADGTRLTLQIADLSSVNRICRYLELPVAVEKRKRVTAPAMPGYDNSHISPFATNGNGETFLEPASRNRARGAKPVDNKLL